MPHVHTQIRILEPILTGNNRLATKYLKKPISFFQLALMLRIRNVFYQSGSAFSEHYGSGSYYNPALTFTLLRCEIRIRKDN